MKRFILVPILTVFLLFLVACAPAQKDPSTDTSTAVSGNVLLDNTDLARTDSQGAITIKISPFNLDDPGDTLKFDVVMDTHSIDLSMDLTILAALTTDTGLSLRPTLWDGPMGGHHVEGTLSFPTTQNGKSILEGTKQLTLTISNVDNVTRVFEWDLSGK